MLRLIAAGPDERTTLEAVQPRSASVAVAAGAPALATTIRARDHPRRDGDHGSRRYARQMQPRDRPLLGSSRLPLHRAAPREP
jgi:hypothetical protein